MITTDVRSGASRFDVYDAISDGDGVEWAQEIGDAGDDSGEDGSRTKK